MLVECFNAFICALYLGFVMWKNRKKQQTTYHNMIVFTQWGEKPFYGKYYLFIFDSIEYFRLGLFKVFTYLSAYRNIP